MRRNLLVSLIMTVAVAGLVWSGMGASAKTHSFPSTVTIHQAKHPRAFAVVGKVLSPVKSCRQHRAVQVFKRVGKKQSPSDTPVGSASTGDDYRWGPVTVPGPGRYYAHVDEVVGSGHGYYGGGTATCREDTSPAIQIKK